MDLIGIRRGWSAIESIRGLPWVVAALVLMFAVSATLTALARAEGCSALTEQVRKREMYASELPDCRAYEQVSPVEKGLTNVYGGRAVAQAAPAGAEMAYFSNVPFPGGPGGKGEVPTYLSGRFFAREEWLTEGLLPFESAPGQGQDAVIGLSEDMALTVLYAVGPALAPGAVPGETHRNLYAKDNATDTYQLVAPDTGRGAQLYFVDSTPKGSRVLFETQARLTPDAQSEVMQLYEWNENRPASERLSLVGLPNKAASAGPGGPAVSETDGGGASLAFYTQHTISSDGTRVFFSDDETGRIYVREPDAKPAVTMPVSKGQAFWRAATPDGRYVLYTEGSELYRFNVEKNEDEVLTSGAEGVLGTLGMSDDGSYVYFAAPGVLATNESGNGETAEKGAANIYEWHNGDTTFIAKGTESENWSPGFNKGEIAGPAGGEKSSRVTPDGRTILFASRSSLTSYNSNGHIELYRYTAARPLGADNPVCASCSPENAEATADARLTALLVNETSASDRPGERNAFLTRNLSNSGGRVFFETNEGLLSTDKNGQTDVYEWEREGEGSCSPSSSAFRKSDDSCLYLISTGRTDEASYFGDANADGSDVFFFTSQSLASQDLDGLADVYDARVEGGILSQNPSSPVTCSGEACRSPSGVPPLFGASSSSTLSGSGNLSPAPPLNGPKPKTPAQIKAEKRKRALKACRSKPRTKRKRCEAFVRKRYGSTHKAKKTTQRGGRRS